MPSDSMDFLEEAAAIESEIIKIRREIIKSLTSLPRRKSRPRLVAKRLEAFGI